MMVIEVTALSDSSHLMTSQVKFSAAFVSTKENEDESTELKNINNFHQFVKKLFSKSTRQT